LTAPAQYPSTTDPPRDSSHGNLSSFPTRRSSDLDRVWSLSDRNNRVLGNIERLFSHGRLGGTGYVSILPVDQGIEHSAGEPPVRSEEHTSELQSLRHFVCRRLLDKKKKGKRKSC